MGLREGAAPFDPTPLEASGQQFQINRDRDVRCIGIGDSLQLAILPLARDQWRLDHFVDRAVGPVHRANHGVQVGAGDGRYNCLRIFKIVGPLHHIRDHFGQGVLEPDRLRPRPVCHRRLPTGQIACRRPSQRR